MNNTEIHEDETLEDLQIGGLKLLQKKNGFRFGILPLYMRMIRLLTLVPEAECFRYC